MLKSFVSYCLCGENSTTDIGTFFRNTTLKPIREAFLADQTLPVPGAITIALAGAGPGAFPPAGRRAKG